MSTTLRSTRNLWLTAFGLGLAVISATQSLRAVDDQVLDVRTVSEPADISVVVNQIPVVRIVADTCQGREAGSGFVLGQGVVVTAAHVVEGALTATIDIDGLGAQPATVLGVDGHGRDIALLYVPALADAPEVAISTARTLERGTPVSSAGHPHGGVRQTLPGEVLGYVDTGPMAADGGRVLTVSATFEPGMSGGPVVDMSGDIVGVVIGVERNTGTGIAVPAANIADTLEGDNLVAAPSCARRN